MIPWIFKDATNDDKNIVSIPVFYDHYRIIPIDKNCNNFTYRFIAVYQPYHKNMGVIICPLFCVENLLFSSNFYMKRCLSIF